LTVAQKKVEHEVRYRTLV